MTELVARLQTHYQGSQHSAVGEEEEGLKLRFEEDLPLGEYFPLLEAHHAKRQVVATLHSTLTALSQQFRAVQKRLLVRYKDKNPTPLLSFDTLLRETHQSIQTLSVQLEGEQTALSDLSSRLAAASHHLVLLLSLKHGLDRKNTEALRQVFHLGGGEDRVLGGAVMDVEGGEWVGGAAGRGPSACAALRVDEDSEGGGGYGGCGGGGDEGCGEVEEAPAAVDGAVE